MFEHSILWVWYGIVSYSIKYPIEMMAFEYMRLYLCMYLLVDLQILPAVQMKHTITYALKKRNDYNKIHAENEKFPLALILSCCKNFVFFFFLYFEYYFYR